jgi:Ferredoxin-like domain in Api92-like protein
MPNDCYNYLEAPDGDLSLIADYFSIAKPRSGSRHRRIPRSRSYNPLPEVFLDFEKIVPMPKELEGTDWCVENWGTKWNSYDGKVTENAISFNTAWSPPIGVIVALSKRIGKSLRLIYDEPNMDFCGEFIVDVDGRGYTDRVYSPRSDAPKHLKDDLMIDEEEGLDNA